MSEFEIEMAVGFLRSYAHEIRECAERHGLYGSMKADGSRRRELYATRVMAEIVEAHHAADDPEHWLEEMADVVLTALSVCDKEGLDIADAIERKRQYNINRPYLHGKDGDS